ncbi:MAG: SDR family NAD(P)-dependent oxidoreductase [Candidatus Binatia bacterium]
MKGRTVLVTGAAKRVGRAIAIAVADKGADVVVHVHSSSPDEVLEQLSKMGRLVGVVHGDLSNPRDTERVARDALRLSSIDILVNNAAVFFPTPIETVTVAEWQYIIAVNLTAPFLLGLMIGKEMRQKGRGKIIHLGDWSGQRPIVGHLPYCVAKGGLHMLTGALAKMFAPTVQVNEVVLGPVWPPNHYDAEALRNLQQRTPLQRLGQVEDVVRAVRFFAEEEGFVTGASYAVDGGWLTLSPGGKDTVL